jgi:hypothetical protein
MTITLTLTTHQIDELAAAVAAKLGHASARPNRPLSQTETAKALGLSKSTVCRYIAAGTIRTVPGCRDRVPQAEIDRLLLTHPNAG